MLAQGHQERVLLRRACFVSQGLLGRPLVFLFLSPFLTQIKDQLQLLRLHRIQDDHAQPQQEAQQPCNATWGD